MSSFSPNNIGERLIQTLFELAAQKHANNTAIVFGDHTITYRQLNEQAEDLSKTILAEAQTPEIIGISASRSIQTIVAVIAVLKAGKAYLPLDVDYPRERLSHLVQDANLKVCIAGDNEVELFQSLGLDVLQTNKSLAKLVPAQKITQGSKAYVLYTSGSTGKPKGVCMGHKALVNLLEWQSQNSVAGPGTKTLQFAPLSFDVSFQEIFATLTTGGTLVLINDELRIEPEELLQFIKAQNINRIFLPFVALQYLTEAATANNLFPGCLQEVITAGEQLKITPAVERFFDQLPGCSLFNQYGPTECHVVTEYKLTGPVSTWPKLPSIGKAIANTEILILDNNYKELSAGETGELCISGVSLAEGYLNNTELTKSKFINLDRANGKVERIYLPGDLARFLEDGNIEYLGRKDDQVKIRGVRIELGEIEVLLNGFANIKQAVVTADETTDGQKRLVAYLVSATNQNNTAEIKEYLAKELPDFMMPSAFVWLHELAKTSSGKIDKKALPKPDITRPELAVLYKAPKTLTEKNIIEAWAKVLGIHQPGVNDNFFELGGNSLLALKSVTFLREAFGYKLPVTKLYQFPTAAAIATFLEGGKSQKNIEFADKLKQENTNEDIAVIGMAVRLPGINTVAEFWEVLKEGKETTTFFTNEELSPFIDPATKADTNYVKARGIIDKVEEFDAAFFGINPKAAALMDPQQRIFLEIAWEVLEQTGHLPEKYNGTTGVYAGAGNNSYYLNNVLSNQDAVNKIGAFNVMTLNEKDYIASRTAYELDLKGPAVSVYSACSTSLLAIAQAVDAIRKGQCSIAIAGGAAITSPVKSGHFYHEGGILSKDGHCRPFDKNASGTVFSDGAGVVLLKSLAQAEHDGDTIYSVIKGIGVNNDGAGKGSFSAPNAEGQAGAITMAIKDAGLQAADISFIEAHGTATGIGDPIEIEGLNLAFGQQQSNQFCAIGSVKSNMGHLTAASGVAGFIKTTLALFYKQIPATLFYQQANPEIDFANSPFYVNAQLKDWTANDKRRAGVSSFGVGGTNVHVVAEEYQNKEVASGASRPMQLFTWSAKTPQSGQAYAQKLNSYILQNKKSNLADIAYSLHTTRVDFNHRYFAIASTDENEIDILQKAETNIVQEKPAEVVFMFPGQGSQYLNMGHGLYQNEPVYRQAIDECAGLLQPYLNTDIRLIIFPEQINIEAEQRINNTFYTQPAIFITEYALAKLWMSWGIHPTILCGHSIGEVVAAHLAGVFSLADAIKFIALRSKLVSDLPQGKMLSIRTDVESLKTILPQALSIAAINSDSLIVVAGAEKDIIHFSGLLTTREIPNKVLLTSHAFHSSMMNPIVEELQGVVEGLTLHRPLKPIMS
ncbi:MAG TPA: amino acid adenylation domain-containing protein, partial [Segetibacter sp.]